MISSTKDYLKSFAYILVLLFAITACNDSRIEISNDGLIPKISLINHTGHWDAHCADGLQLTFVLTHSSGTQELDVLADSFGAYVNADLKEDDMLSIKVLDENGNILLSKSKAFKPSNPEDNGPAIASGPYIRVCQLDLLETHDF